MNNYLLDTNILILHLRGRSDIAVQLKKWSATSTLFISVVTRTEILAGMHPHQTTRTMALLNSLTSIAVDETIADEAGRLIYQYARRNIRLSFPDTLIAVTALQNNLTLVTTNVKHFPMPALRLHVVK